MTSLDIGLYAGSASLTEVPPFEFWVNVLLSAAALTSGMTNQCLSMLDRISQR